MKKKILMMIQLPPPIHGVSVCNKAIYESKVIQNEFETLTVALNYSKSIEEMQKGGIIKLYRFMFVFFNLLHALVFFRPKLVYFTISPLGSAFYRDVILVIILKLFRSKIVYHLHGKGVCDVKGSLIKKIYSFVFKNSYIICLTESLAGDIKNVQGNARILTCLNGVEFGGTYPIVKSRNGLITITFLSNLLPLKGIYIYLEAMKVLVEKGLDVEVNIAGDFNSKFTKSDLDDFLNRNELLKNKVICHGMVCGEAKWSLLSRTHILVHPTLNDALPLVLLEAMASGCYLISTFQGGIPDILSGKPFAYLLDDVRSDILAEKVEFVIREKLTEHISSLAINEYNNKYKIEHFEERISKILQELVYV